MKTMFKVIIKFAKSEKKTCLCYMQTKAQISLHILYSRAGQFRVLPGRKPFKTDFLMAH